MEQIAGVPRQARAQVRLVEVDLAQPLPDLPGDGTDGLARLLVRLHGEPLGWTDVPVPADGTTASALEPVLELQWESSIRARLRTDVGGALRAARGSTSSPFASAHRQFLRDAPAAAVVVCTRERPQGLRQCLESLVRQDHPAMIVFVVDNSGPSRAGPTRSVVDDFSRALDVHYVRVPRPGLSGARNAALATDLGADFVAWLDDDEVADPMWLSESVRALHERRDAAGVSGLVLPAELRTREQVWFEDFGGHSKGRGFTPDVFVPGAMHQSPYFPLPPFGVGANMTFRVEALRSLGGFDEALGAGSPARGGEDTKVFTQLLVAGMCLVYQPSAITRHSHRSDLEGLAAQLYGYGTGLGAYYAALVLDRPSVLGHLARLAPRALRELRSADGLRSGGLGSDFPAEIMSANKRGMLAGPWLYLRGRTRRVRGPRAV